MPDTVAELEAQRKQLFERWNAISDEIHEVESKIQAAEGWQPPIHTIDPNPPKGWDPGPPADRDPFLDLTASVDHLIASLAPWRMTAQLTFEEKHLLKVRRILKNIYDHRLVLGRGRR